MLVRTMFVTASPLGLRMAPDIGPWVPRVRLWMAVGHSLLIYIYTRYVLSQPYLQPIPVL